MILLGLLLVHGQAAYPGHPDDRRGGQRPARSREDGRAARARAVVGDIGSPDPSPPSRSVKRPGKPAGQAT
jgi:hypothetical protein